MSDSAGKGDRATGPAAKLGAELRAARRALGWEIPQLAESLRIRQPYLEAIESGRVADLPGTTYAMGFVRAYASALGMDAEAVAKRFRDEAVEVTGKPALKFPAPVPRRGVPAGALILLGLVVLSGAYALWYRVTEHRQTPVETVPPIPDRLAAPEKSAPSPQVASILPGAAAPAPATAPAPVMPAPATPTVGATDEPDVGSGSHLQTLQQSHDAAQRAEEAAAAGGVAPVPAGQAGSMSQLPTLQESHAAAAKADEVAAAAAAPAGGRILLKFTGDAWVTVKQKGGPALLNKMMHAGDSFAVPADKEGLTFTTGYAGATEVDVDGTPIPGGLGAGGVVRRDIPLDAELLKSGKLPPAKKPAALIQP